MRHSASVTCRLLVLQARWGTAWSSSCWATALAIEPAPLQPCPDCMHLCSPAPPAVQVRWVGGVELELLAHCTVYQHVLLAIDSYDFATMPLLFAGPVGRRRGARAAGAGNWRPHRAALPGALRLGSGALCCCLPPLLPALSLL